MNNEEKKKTIHEINQRHRQKNNYLVVCDECEKIYMRKNIPHHRQTKIHLIMKEKYDEIERLKNILKENNIEY